MKYLRKINQIYKIWSHLNKIDQKQSLFDLGKNWEGAKWNYFFSYKKLDVIKWITQSENK